MKTQTSPSPTEPDPSRAEAIVVDMTWTLSDAQGQTLDAQTEPRAYLLDSADVWPALNPYLHDTPVGETLEIQLEPEQAFGAYDAMLILVEPRSAFAPDIEAGMVIERLPAACSKPEQVADFYTVSDVYPEHVVLDGNHPLAGIALRLRATIHARRKATLAEHAAGTAGEVGLLSTVFTLAPSPSKAEPTGVQDAQGAHDVH